MKRRQFVQRFMQGGMLLGSGMSILPSLAMQRNTTRRFLFVFCDGAWDTSMVFAPEMLGNPYVHTDYDDVQSTIGGLSFVDGANRPEVRRFFEQWADQCLIINGLDFETVAHDRAKRILMTGSPVGTDDWGAIIGANSPKLYTAPHLLMSGPTFSTNYSNAILRVGENNELSRLLEPFESDSDPTREHESLVADYLYNRSTQTHTPHPQTQNFVDDYQRANLQLQELKQQLRRIDLNSSNDDFGYDCSESFMGQAQIALDFFANDLTRCAIVQDQGFCNMRWDSHADYFEQNWHYDLLFLGLQQLMEALQTRTNLNGTPLIEETTVVVCSEMSRHPALNEMGGKHHWPVGSAMIIGGVQGGRTIGGYTDQVLGQQMDINSGEMSNRGVKLKPSHLGATLLAMADLDPLDFGTTPPIMGGLL